MRHQRQGHAQRALDPRPVPDALAKYDLDAREQNRPDSVPYLGEEPFRLLVQNSPDMLSVPDSDGTIRTVATAVLQSPRPLVRSRDVVAQAREPGETHHRSKTGAKDAPVGRSVGESIPPRIDTDCGVRLRPLKEALEGPEREIILRALEICGWVRHKAAKALAIERTTLYKKMRKYGLLGDHPEARFNSQK